MASGCDLAFACMGTEVRLVVEGPGAPGAGADARAWLHEADRRLSRFRPESELCALNADPRAAVPASPLLRAAVGAALWAAHRTGGLVDPTLLGALRAAGYTRSLAGRAPAPLAEARATAPPRAPAAPHPAAAWRASPCPTATTASTAPRASRIDTGGTTRAWPRTPWPTASPAPSASPSTAGATCASAARRRGAGPTRSGRAPADRRDGRGPADRGGGVATSGLGARLWARPGGGHAHHLLDPATGAPAWTGLISVTALAPTALEAETIAKAALLSGPDGARGLPGPLRRRARPRRRRRGRRRPAPAVVGARDRGGRTMTAADPLAYGWWLASRAAGVVALLSWPSRWGSG